MYNDPITGMSPDEIKKELGGNLNEISNFCCVRVSHALISCGHKIT